MSAQLGSVAPGFPRSLNEVAPGCSAQGLFPVGRGWQLPLSEREEDVLRHK